MKGIKGAATSDEYIAALPEDRKEAITKVRTLVRKSLPAGYVEGMIWDAICWFVPLSRYSNTRDGQPLGVVGLASQKQHMALYLMTVYGDPALRKWFEAAYRKSGKRFDMGKSCVRFRSLDDLPLDVIAETLGKVSVDQYIAQVERALGARKSPKQKKVAAKQVAAKKVTKKASSKKTKSRSGTTETRAKAKAVKKPGKRAAKPKRARRSTASRRA